MEINIAPLSKNILIQLEPIEAKVGNIHIPESAKSMVKGPILAKVLQIGPEVSAAVKPGMRLALFPYASVIQRNRLSEDVVVIQEDYINVIIGSV